jgi:hypothetical protein
LPFKRRKRWPAAIAVALVCILAAGIAAWVILSQVIIGQGDARSNAHKSINDAIALIQQSDLEMTALDQQINTEVTSDNLPDIQLLINRIPDTKNTLQSALNETDSALPNLDDDADVELAKNVQTSIKERLTMLDAANTILSLDCAAMNSSNELDAAWNLILSADDAMRSAAALTASQTPSGGTQAVDLDNSALDYLGQATDHINAAASDLSGIDFSSITNYIQLKQSSAQLALDADNALAAGNMDDFASKNDAFNAADAQVTAAAQAIPSEPVSLITSAYDQQSSDALNTYQQARSAAADADASIRQYTGIGIQ